MKKICTNLRAHLDARTTTMCYCWRITRRDGVIQGFAAHAPGQLRGVLEDDQVVRIYQLYDAAGRLLWENPYSLILDGQAYPILSPTAFDDEAPSREIVIAAATPDTCKVVYSGIGVAETAIGIWAARAVAVFGFPRKPRG
jgi:hypothetical protein